MCGRFTLTLDAGDLRADFPEFSFPEAVMPRYNIAPTQPILVLPNNGSNRADYFVWGLIPSWAKEASFRTSLINARAETLAEKPAFRSAYKYHRCLIFADGFYEWQLPKGSKVKIPHHFFMKDRRSFAFAGLWDEWHAPDGSTRYSAAIITTEPNGLLSQYHNRMPVILPRDAYAQWLDQAPQPAAALAHLLRPFPAGEMDVAQVSLRVNTAAIDEPSLIQPD
jgi:putative SOS response-associated peptidase YedK